LQIFTVIIRVEEIVAGREPMEHRPDDLRGMSAAEAKEYILHHITALKLAEKARGDALADLDKWEKRVDLARRQGAGALAAEAEREAAQARTRSGGLAAEAAELRGQVQRMRTALPALAARERSVDPDLLEQELLMVLGKDLPSADAARQADTDRALDALEAGAALEALKSKMGLRSGGGGTGDAP
jgi:hypothetical protein